MEEIIGDASAGKRATAVNNLEMKLALVWDTSADAGPACQVQGDPAGNLRRLVLEIRRDRPRPREGGQSAAIALTLIEKATANGVEPLGYLEWVLSHGLETQASPKDFPPCPPGVPESIKMAK